MRKTQDSIKSIININNTFNKRINYLKIKGNNKTKPKNLSDFLNNFFVTITQKIKAKLVRSNKHHPK